MLRKIGIRRLYQSELCNRHTALRIVELKIFSSVHIICFQVLEAIFSYINMLKQIGPSERIYEEIKVNYIN